MTDRPPLAMALAGDHRWTAVKYTNRSPQANVIFGFHQPGSFEYLRVPSALVSGAFRQHSIAKPIDQ
jgi:hypothetical protein